MASTSPAVLTLIGDPELAGSTERVAAAVGVRSHRTSAVPGRKVWMAAAAVVLDEDAARRCGRQLPRRGGVFLVTPADPSPSSWAAAMSVGAEQLCVLPAQEADLVRGLAEAAEGARGQSAPGCVVAVTAGRGGAGASVFATALAAHGTADTLLVDLDPWAGGIDLLIGAEAEAGLRWADLRLQAGRLTWTALRAALPRHRGVSVLSGSRRCHEVEAGPMTAVLDAGRRGGATVVCDVPRRMTAPETSALDCADLVVVVTTCDVRAVAATAALMPVLRSVNPNLGLVVRGPSPGGLRARDAADLAETPLLASMRPEPMLAERLERGGLRLRHRSPLAAAARRVLSVLPRGQARAA